MTHSYLPSGPGYFISIILCNGISKFLFESKLNSVNASKGRKVLKFKIKFYVWMNNTIQHPFTKWDKIFLTVSIVQVAVSKIEQHLSDCFPNSLHTQNNGKSVFIPIQHTQSHIVRQCSYLCNRKKQFISCSNWVSDSTIFSSHTSIFYFIFSVKLIRIKYHKLFTSCKEVTNIFNKEAVIQGETWIYNLSKMEHKSIARN